MKGIMLKRVMSFLLLLLSSWTCWASEEITVNTPQRVIVAYVTSWSKVMPNPQFMTHINYAFGHVTDSFDGVRIDEEERLKSIVALKSTHPTLKVSLSVGGWGSGSFSEMAADEHKRLSFARDCSRVVKEYNLDGIDIDWEYPTSSASGISSDPDDTRNFTLLMRDLREALGTDRLLTIATIASAEYIDFRSILPYVDFVNIMAYDMGAESKHHAALYPSAYSGWLTASQAVKAHLEAGVPASRLTMGLPFYGRGYKGLPDFVDYKDLDRASEQLERRWDEAAQVPYLVNAQGELVLGFEDPRSLAIKCRYIREQGLLGGMYWEYAGDNPSGDMQQTVYRELIGK